MVYDLSNNLIAIAQTNFNSTTSSIVDFKAAATSIPNVSGVASSASVTQTATGAIGFGVGVGGKTATASGGKTTSTGAGTGTGTGVAASSTTSKSVAAISVPVLDMRALLVLGIAGACAALGGGCFLT